MNSTTLAVALALPSRRPGRSAVRMKRGTGQRGGKPKGATAVVSPRLLTSGFPVARTNLHVGLTLGGLLWFGAESRPSWYVDAALSAGQRGCEAGGRDWRPAVREKEDGLRARGAPHPAPCSSRLSPPSPACASVHACSLQTPRPLWALQRGVGAHWVRAPWGIRALRTPR